MSNDKHSVASMRILEWLTLRAWLPAALFVVSITFVLEFRNARSVNITDAARKLAANPGQLLIFVVTLVVISVVVTQVLSLGAVTALEGYWRRRGPVAFARTLMIRRHVRKKSILIKRLYRAYESAFRSARPRILASGVPLRIINAMEAQVLGEEPPPLTAEEYAQFSSSDWRSWCDAWRLARVDHLMNEEQTYPVSSRILPTKLGNLIRSTEDSLLNADGDLQSFVLQGRAAAPYWVQLSHDQSRNRLELYCTLVFINALIAVLTLVILLGHGINIAAITIIFGFFVILAAVSYRAAIVSAIGYCEALKQIDKASMA